jgi:hypothetical protein
VNLFVKCPCYATSGGMRWESTINLTLQFLVHSERPYFTAGTNSRDSQLTYATAVGCAENELYLTLRTCRKTTALQVLS